jgi:hypothetical protein
MSVAGTQQRQILMGRALAALPVSNSANQMIHPERRERPMQRLQANPQVFRVAQDCANYTTNKRYATPRTFIGVLISGTEAVRSDCWIVLAASGLSHTKAKTAAIRSQAIMAQKTLVHEPVFSNNQAAPTPAKKAPAPFAV